MPRVSLIALLFLGVLAAPVPSQTAAGDSARPPPSPQTPAGDSVPPPLDVRWTAGIRNGATAPPLAAGGRLYVATARQDVKAFAGDGRELWSRRLGEGFQASPVLAEGVLVVASPHPDATAYGLDPATGETRWDRPVGDIAQSLLVSPGRVVFLSLNGRLTALDPRSGEPLWETRLEGLYPGPANAHLTPDDLHTLSAEGLIVRFDPATGQRRATRRLDISAVALLPAPDGEGLLVALHDGRILPFDAALEPAGRGFETAPVLHAPTAAGGRLAVPGSDRVLRAYALDGGDGLWSRTFPVAFAGRPAFSPDGARVAVGDLAGTLWTLDAAEGRILSRTPGPGGALVPAWSAEALAAVTERGTLLVLDADVPAAQARGESPVPSRP